MSLPSTHAQPLKANTPNRAARQNSKPSSIPFHPTTPQQAALCHCTRRMGSWQLPRRGRGFRFYPCHHLGRLQQKLTVCELIILGSIRTGSSKGWGSKLLERCEQVCPSTLLRLMMPCAAMLNYQEHGTIKSVTIKGNILRTLIPRPQRCRRSQSSGC